MKDLRGGAVGILGMAASQDHMVLELPLYIVNTGRGAVREGGVTGRCFGLF